MGAVVGCSLFRGDFVKGILIAVLRRADRSLSVRFSLETFTPTLLIQTGSGLRRRPSNTREIWEHVDIQAITDHDHDLNYHPLQMAHGNWDGLTEWPRDSLR